MRIETASNFGECWEKLKPPYVCIIETIVLGDMTISIHLSAKQLVNMGLETKGVFEWTPRFASLVNTIGQDGYFYSPALRCGDLYVLADNRLPFPGRSNGVNIAISEGLAVMANLNLHDQIILTK